MRARSLVLVAPLLLCGVALAQSSEKIVIDGSTGVMPLAASLATAFQKHEPAVTIEMGTGLGTKARIKALSEGKIDVALASHGIDIGELGRAGLVVHEIARVPVVFGIHSSVSVANLTDAQLCDIYTGKVTSWKSLGGPEMPVSARTRPDSEVDAEVARASIECLRDVKMPEAVKVMAKGGDMAKELAATPGSIGMTTMTVVEQSRGVIRAVALNGVAPTRAEVDRNAYRLVRQSYFVVRNPPSPAVTRFLAFAQGSAGARVINDNGAIPVGTTSARK